MKNFNFEPLHKDVRKHAASGVVFSGVNQVVRLLTQFLSVVVMARLLEPSDFGIMAMVGPVYAFATMFGHLGLNQATVQRPNITSEQVNSFFWISVGVSTLVCLLLIGISPFVGWFYKEPRTVALTIAMALLIPLSGVGNQHGAILYRKMEFRAQAVINIASLILSLLGSIAWGYLFGGYWSLYIGMALGSVVSLVGVWMVIKWRPGRPALAKETSEMLRYGLNMTAGNFIYFITGSINSVVIGRSMGDRALGLYDRATKLLSAPLQQLTVPISNAMVPMLCQLQNDEDRYRRTFLRTIGSLMLVASPGVIWAVALPDLLVTKLMGPKWLETTAIFAALSLAALPQLINDSAGWLMTSQGRAKDYARWSLFHSIISITALFIGMPFGIIGIARAMAISQILRTPFLWWFACRVGPVQLKSVITALTPQVTGSIAAYVILLLLRHSGLLGPWPLLIAGVVLSYAVTLFIMSLFPHGKEAILRDYEFVKFLLQKILSKVKPVQPAPLT